MHDPVRVFAFLILDRISWNIPVRDNDTLEYMTVSNIIPKYCITKQDSRTLCLAMSNGMDINHSMLIIAFCREISADRMCVMDSCRRSHHSAATSIFLELTQHS